MAIKGIKYVTELENIGEEICTSLLNIVFARAVPITERTIIYQMDVVAF